MFWTLSGLKLAALSALRGGSAKAPLPRSTGLKIVSNTSIVPPLALSLPATRSKPPPPKDTWPVGLLFAVLPAGTGGLTTSGLIDDPTGPVTLNRSATPGAVGRDPERPARGAR